MSVVDSLAADGYGRVTSCKDGRLYVQPPCDLLKQILAVRLHLQTCGVGDGPLRIVSGSHRHGRLSIERAQALRDQAGEIDCLAAPGDALLMRPLVLHASSKAVAPTSARRVLHFLFGPANPGHGLQWSEAA